jgi:hypothetical protein
MTQKSTRSFDPNAGQFGHPGNISDLHNVGDEIVTTQASSTLYRDADKHGYKIKTESLPKDDKEKRKRRVTRIL